MTDSALLETIMVATEAKTEALLAAGSVSGTPTDAVIAASEGEIKHHYACAITEPGRRVRDAVLKGVPEALRRYESGDITEPAFFIYEPFRGGALGGMAAPQLPLLSLPFPRPVLRLLLLPVLPVQERRTRRMVSEFHKRPGLELLALHPAARAGGRGLPETNIPMLRSQNSCAL